MRVKIPTVLRSHVGGQTVLSAEGATVREVLASIERDHPGFAAVVMEQDGTLKRFLALFLGEEDVRYRQGLDTPVPEGSTMVILPAASGGARW